MNDTAVQTGVPTIAPEAFAAALRNRRTTNFFELTEPPIEQLRAAIDIARWAPNHKLTEPWHFYLLGAETIAALRSLVVETKVAAKGESVRGKALQRVEAVPGWFVLTCKTSDDALRQREDYASCCCAIQNLSLYLWQVGVGVKWTTGAVTRDPRFYQLVGIDADKEFVVGLFWYGYPKAVPDQERLPLTEICTEVP
jgi:nitroreductase